MPLLAWGDITQAEFLLPGLIPLVGALVASLGITTRIQGDTLSWEPRRTGVVLAPNLAAFWYLGFQLGPVVPLLGILTFVFCAMDGMPFGRILTAAVGTVTDTGRDIVKTGDKLALEDVKWQRELAKRDKEKNVINLGDIRGRTAAEEANIQIGANRAKNKMSGQNLKVRPWMVTSKNAKQYLAPASAILNVFEPKPSKTAEYMTKKWNEGARTFATVTSARKQIQMNRMKDYMTSKWNEGNASIRRARRGFKGAR